MTAAQLNAAAKRLYKEHMWYEEGVVTTKWKNLPEDGREMYRRVVREIYRAAMSA